VFGNAIAPRLGVRGYLCFYFAAAAFVGTVHALTSNRTFVGASCAIDAVVGMFLVVHPKDRVRTLAMVGAPVDVPGYAAVMLWIALDLWGLTETTNVDHAGHLLGFLFGFVTAVILIRTRRMPLASFEVTLLDLGVGRWLAGPSPGLPTKGPRKR
jgi:membrane associated rhomboid family serine protease